MSKKKKIKWGVFLIVIIGLAIWMHSRWDVWFSIPDEPPYTAPDNPSRIMLTFGTDDENARNVSWQCDSVVKKSFLEYADSAGKLMRVNAHGEVFVSRSGKAAFYVAKLRQLTPDIEYRYRVCTDGKYSPWFSFHTYPLKRDGFEMMYVGDVQDTINGEANKMLKAALKRHPGAEMLVCGGDLIERPSDIYWEETFRDLDSIRQYMPMVVVTGNHDFLKTVPRTLERRFSLVFSYFLDSMVEQGFLGFGEYNQVYNLKYANAELFLLDSNREPTFLLTQREWLKEKLAQSKAKWKIVVLHHPLYSIKGSMNNFFPRQMFDDLIQEGGVDVVLQGHEHQYARMTTKVPADEENGQWRPSTPVYFISHCSPKNYRTEFPEEYDRFGLSSRYYQTVRIMADTMVTATYDAYSHELYDSLRIIKRLDGTPVVEDYGISLPEHLEYQPDPDNKKDMKFAARIQKYIERKKSKSVPAM